MLSARSRIVFAFRCFFALLFKGFIPADILEQLRPGRPSPAPASDSVAPRESVPAGLAPAPDQGERAVQLLALLQRDGRLVDFLREDIMPYSDAQVGAAVRDIHARCRQVLERYLAVEPILADEEGQTTVISTPVDPAVIKLVGAVGTQVTYRGTVRHRGWRAGRVELPPLAAADARLIVAPAEVEVA
jgi:hypothetical protein